MDTTNGLTYRCFCCSRFSPFNFCLPLLFTSFHLPFPFSFISLSFPISFTSFLHFPALLLANACPTKPSLPLSHSHPLSRLSLGALHLLPSGLSLGETRAENEREGGGRWRWSRREEKRGEGGREMERGERWMGEGERSKREGPHLLLCMPTVPDYQWTQV